MVEIDQHSPYRATLHHAIWARDYFLECLDGTSSPHKVELQKGHNDGKKILAFLKKPAPDNYRDKTFPSNNIYRIGGKFRPRSVAIMHKEDRDMLLPYLLEKDRQLYKEHING